MAVLVSSRDSADEPPAPAAAAEVETFDVASFNHVPGTVDYAQTPPVGGDHNQVWTNCGSYDEPAAAETAVQSMEHGAVWITYRPDLPGDVIDELQAIGSQPYVVVSPWPGDDLPAPVVASAWGAQLELQDPSAPELTDFLTLYRQAPTAPEPGAPCTGGVDGDGTTG